MILTSETEREDGGGEGRRVEGAQREKKRRRNQHSLVLRRKAV